MIPISPPPEERAKEITRRFSHLFIDNGEELRNDIAAQIREAEKEASEGWTIEGVRNVAYAEGFNAAKEIMLQWIRGHKNLSDLQKALYKAELEKALQLETPMVERSL